jgi:hypothetical protein
MISKDFLMKKAQLKSSPFVSQGDLRISLGNDMQKDILFLGIGVLPCFILNFLRCFIIMKHFLQNIQHRICIALIKLEGFGEEILYIGVMPI